MFITYDDIPDPSDELDAVDKGNCVQGLLRASNEPSSKKYLMRITDNRKKAFPQMQFMLLCWCDGRRKRRGRKEGEVGKTLVWKMLNIYSKKVPAIKKG